MGTFPGIRARRSCARGVVGGAVLALTLSVSTAAFAQAGGQPANAPIVAPKQVGSWTVTGFSQGYCAAERPVPGATGDGGSLQFVVARLRTGYRIALASQEWELKPQAAFPIELIAQPVLQTDANAIVAGPNMVIIELGADALFMKKLAIAPMIEVKAAQATFKLPMTGFTAALAEVETCYGAIKQRVSNPFAPPEPGLKMAGGPAQ
jgi:hypothetical protein